MTALYMDEHVPGPITRGLRLRGVDVLTAQEDGDEGLDDWKLLDRATELGRVLFTQDEDLLREGTERQRRGASFAGVVYAHQRGVSIRQCIEELECIALAAEPAEFADQVRYLPLQF